MSAPEALPPDYVHARRAFLTAARELDAAIGTHLLREQGPLGEELAIDVAWLGPIHAANVVLVVSGTHGVEGFVGSLCQSHWLAENGLDRLPSGLALCLVHAHNPYGFAWVRRVNEDNVDLNRNYIDFTNPPVNEAYDELAEAVSPAEWTDEVRAATEAVILGWATEQGFDAVQQAISGGQYRHADGLFYGGSHPATSQHLMREIITGRPSSATRVAILDLHTGLGPRGEVELLTHHEPGSETYERAVSWWGGRVASTEAGGSVSAALEGEWMRAAERWLPAAQVTPIALEWGTVDSISVLQALRADNWLHNHGDPTGTDAPAIKAQLREAFAPDDPEWVQSVYGCYDQVLGQTLDALSSTQDEAAPPA